MRCLFCKAESATSNSKEHIIPESLGNTTSILPPGVVCDRCNNYFAREVEKPFMESTALLLLRFRQGILSKRGVVPPMQGVLLPDFPVEIRRDAGGRITIPNAPADDLEMILEAPGPPLDLNRTRMPVHTGTNETLIILTPEGATPEAQWSPPEPTAAEPVTAAIKLSADKVARGDRFEAQVRIRVFSGFHIYGMNTNVAPFIPTTLTLTLPNGIQEAGEWSGPAPAAAKDGAPLYRDTLEFKRSLRVLSIAPERKLSIGAELRYQARNDQICFPPKSIVLQAPVTVGQ